MKTSEKSHSLISIISDNHIPPGSEYSCFHIDRSAMANEDLIIALFSYFVHLG